MSVWAAAPIAAFLILLTANFALQRAQMLRGIRSSFVRVLYDAVTLFALTGAIGILTSIR